MLSLIWSTESLHPTTHCRWVSLPLHVAASLLQCLQVASCRVDAAITQGHVYAEWSDRKNADPCTVGGRSVCRWGSSTKVQGCRLPDQVSSCKTAWRIQTDMMQIHSVVCLQRCKGHSRTESFCGLWNFCHQVCSKLGKWQAYGLQSGGNAKHMRTNA